LAAAPGLGATHPGFRSILVAGGCEAPSEELAERGKAIGEFFRRLDVAGATETNQAADRLLELGCRWNPLINAISTYINGVELDRLSVKDFWRYRDTGVNWRIAEGYGTLIAALGAGPNILFDCAVTLIDFRSAVVPLGLADKLFLGFDDAEEFPKDSCLIDAGNSGGIGAYHVRPFGRPLIEAYFGGRLARDLEEEGEAAFAAFAIDQLADLMGNTIRKRVRPIAASAWERDPGVRLLLSRSARTCGCAKRTCGAGCREAVLCRRGMFGA
jgi:monoamine oxidase